MHNQVPQGHAACHWRIFVAGPPFKSLHSNFSWSSLSPQSLALMPSPGGGGRFPVFRVGHHELSITVHSNNLTCSMQ